MSSETEPMDLGGGYTAHLPTDNAPDWAKAAFGGMSEEEEERYREKLLFDWLAAEGLHDMARRLKEAPDAA